MVSRRFRIAVAAVSVLAFALAAPAVGAADTRPTPLVDQKAHVNSNVDFTWLYASSTGDLHYNVQLPACLDFWYDRINNGRYFSPDLGGWVSTAKAGPGWCHD